MHCLVIAFCVCSVISVAQDTLYSKGKSSKEISLSGGYSFNYADPNPRNFHLIETRIQRQVYTGFEPILGNLSAGFDVGLNTHRFLVGPRIGFLAGYGTIIIGLDVACYTDFIESSMHIVPCIGLGNHWIRLTVNPHIRLTNRDFEPIDRTHLNISVKLFSLKKEIWQ